MSNKLRSHIKSDSIKWIAVTMAILLIGVALAAALTNGFRDANPYCWLGHTYEKGSTVCSVCGEPCEHKSWQDGKCKDCGYVCEHDYKNGKCTICGEKEAAELRETTLEVGSVKENGIKLMSSVMPMAVDTVKVTATVEPADVTEKLLWSITDNNGYFTAHAAKYIEMNVADDQMSVTLRKLDNFSEVFILACASSSNPKVEATCTLNCRALIQSIEGFEIGYVDNLVPSNNQVINLSSDNLDCESCELRSVMIGRGDSSSAYSIYFKLLKDDIIRSVGTKEHKVKLDILCQLGDDFFWDWTDSPSSDPGSKDLVYQSHYLEVSDMGDYYYATFSLDNALFDDLFTNNQHLSAYYSTICDALDGKGSLFECLYFDIEINCSDESCIECYTPYLDLTVEFSRDNFTEFLD